MRRKVFFKKENLAFHTVAVSACGYITVIKAPIEADRLRTTHGMGLF